MLGCEAFITESLKGISKWIYDNAHCIGYSSPGTTDLFRSSKYSSIRGTPELPKNLAFISAFTIHMFSTGKISPKKLEDIMNTMLEMAGLHLFPQWDLLRKCQLGHGQIICLSSPYGFLAYIPILKELR